MKPTTPEPLPLDPEHLRPVFNPHKPVQRVTSTHAEPLTLSLQFTGTPDQIDRNRQTIAGQLTLIEEQPR